MAKRLLTISLATALAAAISAVPAFAKSDSGNASPSLSFFSGGAGANAHWAAKDADSDGDGRDIVVNTTNGAPTFAKGYAGVEVHHVYGIPTASYPTSSYEVKSDFSGDSLGSPRLVIRFSDGGRAELRPLTDTTTWEHVGDPDWDNNGGSCGFLFETTWNTIQGCHAGTFVTDAYWVADAYGHTHWLDELNTAGQTWTQPSDNG